MDAHNTWYILPLVVVIILVYSASRYELTSRIGRCDIPVLLESGMVVVHMADPCEHICT